MTHAHEAVKTRHKESSLVFPVLALAVLFFWGSSQSLPVVIAINILALVGILSSAFSVVRHADLDAGYPLLHYYDRHRRSGRFLSAAGRA